MRAASIVSARQRNLLRAKVEEMDINIAAPLQTQIHSFKDALAIAINAGMACAPTSENAGAMQARLAKLLNANLPEKPFQPSTESEPESEDQIYGSDLKIAVSAPSNFPSIRIIQASFGIECGDDTLMLLYQTSPAGWQPTLRWQSPDYKEIDGAFGDFFLTSIVTGQDPGAWRVVVAHGRPWCTSRFSGFDMDLLAPGGEPGHPRVVWHTERGYSRADFDPRLRAAGDTFELRLHNDEMSFDPDNAFERLVIYRYRVSGDKVTRIEPIAANARGFVEEWLSMPWEEALAQSSPGHSDTLQSIHKQYELSFKDTGNYTNWHSGPVRACTTQDHFQVAMSTERERIIPGKPGGESTPGPTYYFHLQQDDGYRLLAITTAPDPTCNGPDLMRTNDNLRRQKQGTR